MSYTPLNQSVYAAAYAGTLAGSTYGIMYTKGLRTLPTQASAGEYAGLASNAGAFAQAFDTQWGANPASHAELDSIKHMCETIWGTKISENIQSSTYPQLAGSLVSIIQAASAYNLAQGIPLANKATPLLIPVDVDDFGRQINLYVEDVGVATKGTMVFLHGAGANMSEWIHQTTYFYEDGYRVISIDMRGHGGSDKPSTTYSLDLYADDLRTVLDTLQVEDVVLIGHSLGASIALHYAARHNEAHISKLVLVGVAAVDNGVTLAPEVLAGFLYLLQADFPSAVKAVVDTTLFGGTYSPEDGYYFFNLAATTPIWVVKEELILANDGVGVLRADCAAVTVPTLIIHGTNDAVTSFTNAQTQHSLIEGSVLVEFENSGHLPHWGAEQALWNTTVANFMNT